MEKRLTAEQLEALKAIDTPTVCNAIERFRVRSEVEGFCGMGIRCLFPELGVMLGYALTLKVDSTTPGEKRDDEVWKAWVRAMETAPTPSVLVLQDVGPAPMKSAHVGEMMATLARRLGVVGWVTDGGVRDILEVQRLGVHYFAAGVVPAHGNPRLLEVNVPVTIDGVPVHPGDMLHGDINGVTTIPWEIAGQVAEEALRVRTRESALLEYMHGPDFSVEGYFSRKFTH